jgi:aspartyl-tRNA(Asn)/glutamyl-tRNA(Gln) amidotransferase subunit A
VRRDYDRVFVIPNALSGPPRVQAVDDATRVHVLMHPSAIRTAPPLPSVQPSGDTTDASSLGGLDAYTQDVLTVPASLAGLPALSVPAGLGADGWPMGVTVVGQWGCDDMVLHVGEWMEKAAMEAA